jgi:hypothetical protein
LRDEFYSQCIPGSEPQTPLTPHNGEGLTACFFPNGSEKFSLITKGNATLHAHGVYSGISIGGSLFDGSPNEHGIVSVYCADCPALIEGDCAPSACGDAPTFIGGTFKFNGQAPAVGAASPFIDKFPEFEDLARTVRSGVYPGSEGCDSFAVHVSSVGGEFSMNDFCTKQHGCNPEDNGCTLVVFNTAEHVLLNKDILGRQFGPSVLAPFSKVTLLDTAGYIDGLWQSHLEEMPVHMLAVCKCMGMLTKDNFGVSLVLLENGLLPQIPRSPPSHLPSTEQAQRQGK